MAAGGRSFLNKIYLAYTVIAVFAIAYFVWSKLGNSLLPPHEFAYGAPLGSIQDLPHAVSQFLSLPALDPAKIRIEASILGGSGGSGDIASLAKYLNAKMGSRPGVANLVSELRRINSIPNPLEKTDALLEALIRDRDIIRDEPNQDRAIVFIFYDLKEPSLLDSGMKAEISIATHTLDSDSQARLFDSQKCPKNFLEGNINIYPLAMENVGWYKSLGLPGDQNRPILEIRFMGLRGIFRFLLDGMEHASGLPFMHLDGEKLPISAN
jgi:hypothetical protein